MVIQASQNKPYSRVASHLISAKSGGLTHLMVEKAPEPEHARFSVASQTRKHQHEQDNVFSKRDCDGFGAVFGVKNEASFCCWAPDRVCLYSQAQQIGQL